MSLSTALNSALSGLNAASRNSAVVSDNIANVLTPGYARRSLEVESRRDAGSGVKIIGVTRHTDPGVIANRRAADANLANAEALSGFYTRLTQVVGGGADENSISTRLTAFDSSLILAASRPESVQRLDDVAVKANELTGLLNQATDEVQSLRMEADRKISIQVDRLNQVLVDVQDLNRRVAAVGGGDSSSLLDQRQRLIDEMNKIVPVNVVNRENGRIALYTEGGAILIDGTAAKLSFTRTNTIVAEMSLQSGALSGLEINGRPVRTDSATGVLRGGSLAAQFQIRDEAAVSAQADLDSVARDLIERFEAPGLDATLAPGSAGLFTDGNAAFDPLVETGLAGRIAVNASADPSQGGASWRLRDGLGAAAPGASGDSRFLQALQSALGEPRTPATGNFGTGQLTASGITSIYLSNLTQIATTGDQRLSFAAASRSELSQIELAQGVDTDAELGRLILIEQAYAANARMISVVDEMMQTLLRI